MDDEKSRIQMTANYLQEAGLNVSVLDDSSKFKDECFTLSQSHIAFIDMKWSNFLKRTSQFRHLPNAPQLNEMVLSNPAKVVETWVEVVRDWTSGASNNPSNKPGILQGQLPRSFIPQNQVGVWFGGMLSWIAPNATLLFFSSDNEAVQQEFAPALTVFRRRPFYVYPKATTNPTSLIVLSDLLPYLSPKQKALLSRREVRSWFIKDVLLRVLGGKDPEEGKVGIPVPAVKPTARGKVGGKVIRYDLNSQYFFPGFGRLSDRNERINFLKNFLEDPSFSREEYIALWQFIHESRHPRDSVSLRKMLDSLEAAGIWGHEAANRLRSLVEIKQVDAIPSIEGNLEMCINLVEAVMCNAADYLRNLCRRLGDKAQFIDSVFVAEDRPIASSQEAVFEPYKVKDKEPGIRILRFPPSWITSILQPLKDNADKHGCDWLVKITADSTWLRILFASGWNSDKAFDREVFWNCVASSNNDGRGLPLAIPRILETNPDQCIVKTGSEITDIWGNSSVNFSLSEASKHDLAIEMSYRYDQLPKEVTL